MKNPMFDKDFLKELYEYHNREVFVKLVSLDFNEIPREEIQGRATGGSGNIDGNSSVRRTCSLTLVAEELNIHEYYWALHTKFKAYIGLKNFINPEYPDIIWFPQGTFLISSFNSSQSTNTYTISIQGKDKMSLLNGEFGGSITSLTWNFGTEEDIDDEGNSTITKYLLKDIIREAVHEFAKEPYRNIILNDLDDLGLELLEYRGTEPLYLLFPKFNTDLPIQMTTNSSIGSGYLFNDKPIDFKNEELEFEFLNLINLDLMGDNSAVPPSIIKDGDQNEYVVAKIEFGEAVGYKTTDLVYAGDLILKAGETIVSMLDKIKKMLGEYEYFYNIDGQFVFQRKKNYIQTSWNNIQNVNSIDAYVEDAATVSPIAYTFDNSFTVTQLQSTPNLSNLKNDYAVWGSRAAASGADIPVHLRYAIDKKPVYYKNYKNEVFVSETYSDPEEGQNVVDWREIIYQMMKDYRKHSHDDDFTYQIAERNKDFYPIGETGYEQYYVDIEGFWRDIYDPECLVTEPDKDIQFYTRDKNGQYLPVKGAKTYYTPEGDKLVPVDSSEIVKIKPMIPAEEEKVYLKGDDGIYYDLDDILYRNYLKFPFYRDKINSATQDYVYKKDGEHFSLLKEQTNNGEYYFPYGYDYWKRLYFEEIEDTFDRTDIIYRTDIQPITLNKADNIDAAREGYDVFWDIRTVEWQGEKPQYKFDEVDLTWGHPSQPVGEEFLFWDDKESNSVSWGVMEYPMYEKIGEGDTDSSFRKLDPSEKLQLEKSYYQKVSENNYALLVEFIPDIEFKEDIKWNDKEINAIYWNDDSDVGHYFGYPYKYYRLLNKEYKPNMLTSTKPFISITKDNEYHDKYIIDENNVKKSTSIILSNVDTYIYEPSPWLLEYSKEMFVKYSNIYSAFDILDHKYYTPDEDNRRVRYNIYQFKDEGPYYNRGDINLGAKWPWSTSATDHPNLLNFWFDFLDTEGELSKYSVPNVGIRPKTENNTSVKSIYFREIPNIIYTPDLQGSQEEQMKKPGYTFFQVPSYVFDNILHLSSRGISAFDKLNDFLYQYATCTDTISLTTLPIYTLEPNTRIYIDDKNNSKFNGVFIITKITVPYTYNGTMNISATRVVDRIL